MKNYIIILFTDLLYYFIFVGGGGNEYLFYRWSNIGFESKCFIWHKNEGVFDGGKFKKDNANIWQKGEPY